jgi:hypothetical protein
MMSSLAGLAILRSAGAGAAVRSELENLEELFRQRGWRNLVVASRATKQAPVILFADGDHRRSGPVRPELVRERHELADSRRLIGACGEDDYRTVRIGGKRIFGLPNRRRAYERDIAIQAESLTEFSGPRVLQVPGRNN